MKNRLIAGEKKRTPHTDIAMSVHETKLKRRKEPIGNLSMTVQLYVVHNLRKK